MNRNMRLLAAGLAVACLAAFTAAKEKNPKPGPLTGTWQCVAHGGSQGDMNFTLYLEQEGETVSGSVTSPIGSTELSTASFQKNKLEIEIDGGDTKYTLTATYKKGQLDGEWATDNHEKGAWEGKKSAESSSPKQP